jgi:hypothetical protein
LNSTALGIFLAHGEQPLFSVLFFSAIAVSLVIGVFVFAKKPKTFAVTFALVAIVVCALLLVLIFRPH